jgi:hypothetical protein
MPMESEAPSGRPSLKVSREPKGPAQPGEKGSMGDRAFMDAVIIVGIAWAVLFALVFSLRGANV